MILPGQILFNDIPCVSTEYLACCVCIHFRLVFACLVLTPQSGQGAVTLFNFIGVSLSTSGGVQCLLLFAGTCFGEAFVTVVAAATIDDPVEVLAWHLAQRIAFVFERHLLWAEIFVGTP